MKGGKSQPQAPGGGLTSFSQQHASIYKIINSSTKMQQLLFYTNFLPHMSEFRQMCITKEQKLAKAGQDISKLAKVHFVHFINVSK